MRRWRWSHSRAISRRRSESVERLGGRLLERPDLVQGGVVVRARLGDRGERTVELVSHVRRRLPAVDGPGGDVSHADSRPLDPWLAAENRVVTRLITYVNTQLQ
jgi:hypothetical protein